MPGWFWTRAGIFGLVAGLLLLPLLPLVRQHSQKTPGGPWSPGWSDVLSFLDLSGVGFASAEQRLIDGFHLRPPGLHLLDWHWHVITLVFFISPICVAVITALRNRGQQSTEPVVVLLGLSLFPLCTAFSYALLSNRPVWAYKALLGVALLLVLLAARGLAVLPRRVGLSLLLALSLFNLFSLVPYYTNWTRSDVVTSWYAFKERARPGDIFVLRWNYEMLVLGYYERAPEFPIAAQLDATKPEMLLHVEGRQGRWAEPICRTVPHVRRIFAISPALLPTMRKAQEHLHCLQSSVLWVYDPGARVWQQDPES